MGWGCATADAFSSLSSLAQRLVFGVLLLNLFLQGREGGHCRLWFLCTSKSAGQAACTCHAKSEQRPSHPSTKSSHLDSIFKMSMPSAHPAGMHVLVRKPPIFRLVGAIRKAVSFPIVSKLRRLQFPVAIRIPSPLAAHW